MYVGRGGLGRSRVGWPISYLQSIASLHSTFTNLSHCVKFVMLLLLYDLQLKHEYIFSCSLWKNMEMTKEVPHGPRMFQFFIEDRSLQTHSKFKYMLVIMIIVSFLWTGCKCLLFCIVYLQTIHLKLNANYSTCHTPSLHPLK